MSVIPLEYFRHHEVLSLSQDLLGKFLLTKIDGHVTGGMIIETEAYRAPDDRASHAYGNRKTNRNAQMFEDGGTAYVYRCYGIHTLFNIVTNAVDIPHAILIRAILPSIGIPTMRERRKLKDYLLDRRLAGGPGMLTQALGISMLQNGVLLDGNSIWLEDRGIMIPTEEIACSPRIGVGYAGEDAMLPWRYRIASYLNFTSCAKA